ncbi:T9SS type B sorting domain-containing protein [Flavobacterium plurextorum]|nr:T9SS type B sorting domain-containing protein [Flavobacterium plurextorum]
MKKPTILRTLIFAVAMLFNFVSHSQNLIAFDSKFDKNLNENVFFKAANQLDNSISLSDKKETSKTEAVAELINPIIPYAQIPYAGQVVECPNDGKKLPKLFLCGGNDSRPIDIKITDAQSIVWERFISGGSCVTVSNSDCANENAAPSCWVQVGTGKDFLANSAGQFRVKIVDKAGAPSVFYFNVYQNTLIPTAVTKSDIIKNSSGTCQIDGKITVGGFGNGYEYSFTTTGAPGRWQPGNTFTTSTPGNYTAFIRIKDVVGSCEFKVINLDIKNVTLAVTTEIVSPRCFDGKGSIKVIKNEATKEYIYNIYKPVNSTSPLTFYNTKVGEFDFTFDDLDPGTYRVETLDKITKCVIDNKTNVVIPNAPAQLTSTLTKVDFTPCNSGSITVTAGGGVTPYRYLVDIDNGGFVQNGTKVITTVRPGVYTVRVIDANGCSIDKKITLDEVNKPVYTITKTDGDCANPNGFITVDVTDNNGFALEYSILGGPYATATYTTSGSVNGAKESKVYINLPPENYIISVRYKKSGVNSGRSCTDPDFPIAIGLTTALTASAGVAELSGCGPTGNVQQGKVRITNAEGGVPFTAPRGPYEYSYDGKKNWTTDKEAYVEPGTHVFYIRDAKCEIPLKAITLLSQPAPPTISVDNPVFNCDGSATTTVTVKNEGSPTTQFTYDYFIDGALNTNNPTNIFKNVTQGDHTISVSYNVVNVPTESVLLNETFGAGPDVSSPGINPNFCWERQVEATKCNNDKLFGNGEYTVTSSLRNNPYGGWWSPKDNTSKGANTNGRFLAVDAGNAIPNNAVLYRKTIKDIIPNVPIKVTFVATNLLIKTNTQPDASLTVELQNGSGVPLSSQSTGKIPKTESWVPYTRTIDPGNNTTLDFVLRLELSQVNGIDFAVDDLVVTQMPKACNTVANFPVYVDGSKAFFAGITGYKDVRCSGEQNGEITLSAKNFDAAKGFQYLVAGDPAGWQTVIPVPAATSGSITLKNLASKIYNISIRYDNTAGSCVFPVAQEIKSPKKLKVDAWVEQVLKCSAGAIIKAKASDGTPGYKYELRETDGVTVVKAFQDSDTFLDIKITGNYKVVAKDLNDCETEVLASVDIVAPVKPKLENITSNVCFDKNTGTNITIKVTDGVPDYTYTVKYNGGNPIGPSATFTGPNFTYKAANEGSYEFIVTDSFGCSSDPITQVITAQLLAVTPVTTPLDCDPAPANRAVITGTIEGGKAPFTVTITTGDKTGDLVPPTTTGNTFTYTTAVAGNYTFTIKDANNCTTTSDAKIEALVPITLSSTDVNPKCSSSSDGTVLLKPGGGSGKFTYSRDGISYDNTSYYTGLSAGVEYTFYVKDDNKCTKSIKVTLTAPDPISGTATITTPYTCDSPATITVGTVVTGGNGVYKYTLNRNGVALITQTTKVFDNISVAGDYTVTITDSNSCTFTTTPKLTIVDLNPPKGMTISTTTAATCPLKEGSVTITNVVDATNTPLPTAGLEYRIVSPTATAFQPSNVFDNIKAGVTYKFEVRDANKCTFEKTHLIDLPKDFTVTGTPTNIKCFGASDGSAIFTVSGMVVGTSYSYSVDTTPPITGSGTSTTDPFDITVSGLGAGLHTIAVTNSVTKCIVREKVTVAGPASALKLDPSDLTHVTCKVLGTAKINAVGGSGTYTYTVTQKTPVAGTAIIQTNDNLFKNLAAGTYSVSVTDGTGCNVAGTDFTINPEVKPIASIDGSSVYCAGGSGATLKVNPNTQTNYTYSINKGTSKGDGTFSGLTPGKYTIRVTDTSTGCFIDLDEEIIAIPISASTKLLADLDCDVAPASSDASIEVTILDGYPDYKYRHNTTGVFSTEAYTDVAAGSNTFTFDTGASGTHYFEITDKKGCTTIVSRVINVKETPKAVAAPTNPKCYNGTDGSIVVTASLGLSPYTYEVSTTSATTGFSTMLTNKLSNVGAGTYWIKVTDSKKCFVVVSQTLTNPAELTAHADVTTPLTCGPLNGTQSATITVTIDNPGTPFTGPNKYLYSYNGVLPAVTSNTYTTTTSGTVSVVVYDANNCPFTVVDSPVIEALDAPKNMTFVAPVPVTCAPGSDKTNLTVKVDNGVAPFKFEITDTDATVVPTAPIATGVLTQDHTFNSLAPGKYYFKVTDANKCTTDGEFTIDKPLPVLVDGSLVSNVVCKGSSDGKLTFTVSGNSGTFTYELRNSANALVPIIQSTQTVNVIDYIGLPAETYTITITNPVTKCTASKTIEVKEASVKFAFNLPTIIPITCSPNNGKVVINTVGGWGNNRYTLTLPNGTVVGPQSNSTFSNLTQSGTYGISVTDLSGTGCTITNTFDVDAPIQPDASIDVDASDLCYDETGKAEIVVIPAAVSPSYRYNINDGNYQVSGTFSNLIPGSYVVKVKDMTTGCILTLPAQTIETELKFNAGLNIAADCKGQNTEIKGTVSGGKEPYTYTVTINGTVDATVRTVTGKTFLYTDPNAANASIHTTYLFTLTDNSTGKCSVTSTVEVAPKTDPAFTAAPNSTILCNGAETGSITVTIDQSKGIGPYEIKVVKDNSALVPSIADVDYGTKTTGLPAGDYKITVTDSKGCFKVETAKIEEPTKIDFKLVDTQITCIGGTTGTTFGSIAVTLLTGGSKNAAPAKSGYTYTLTSNTSPTQVYKPTTNEDHVFQILNFGSYELTVSDINDCSVTKKVDMASPVDEMEIVVAPGTPSCTTASLIVTAKPKIAGGPYYFAKYPLDPLDPNKYDYATYAGLYQSADGVIPTVPAGDPLLLQSTFNNLKPGVIYSFIVYDFTTKCYYFKQAEVATETASTLTSDVKSANVTCTGLGNGNVSFTFDNVQGGTDKVKFEIYNSLTNTLVSPPVSGTVVLPLKGANNVGPLVPGSYYILFTEQDASGATVCVNSSKPFTISQSVVPLALEAKSNVNDNCGLNKGLVEAFARGGTLRAADVALGITAHPYLYQIYADTGAVGAIDGTDPNPIDETTFTTAFDVATQTSNTFNKEFGHYIVYVRDANGCIQSAFVEVKLDDEPFITAVVNSFCANEGSFAIDVELTTTGIGTHYYNLDNTGFVQIPSAKFSIPNLSSGNHSIKIKDFNGCGNTVTLPLIVEPLTIKASFTTPPKCEDTDGEITAVVTGGALPNNLEYTLEKTSLPAITNIVQNNDPKFVGIGAGNYKITVKDLTTTCSRSTTVDLVLPTLIDLVAADISTTPVDCTGAQGTKNNGTLTVNLKATNNNPDYTYILTPVLPAGAAISQPNNNVFTGLSAGDYTVTVKSGRGCEKTVPANVPAPLAVVASAVATPFSCAVDPAITTVVVTGLGGTGSYNFSKNGTDYFASNSATPDNKYTFEIGDIGTVQNPIYWVKDSNGCVQTTTLTTALQPLPKLISATAARSSLPDSQIDCLNNRELIEVTVVGGSVPTNLKYEVSVNSTPYSIISTSSALLTINYPATTAGATYRFRITDNVTGCEILTNLYSVPLFNAINVVATTVADVECKSAKNGSIQITVSGYSGPYTYEVFDGATAVAGSAGTHDTATSNPFIIPFGLGQGGNYTVKVVEQAYPNCNTTSTAVIVKEPAAALNLDPLDVTPLGCSTDGAVTVTAQGGWGNNVYTLTPPSGPAIVNNDGIFGNLRLDGLYGVSVKDANGCVDTDLFTLVLPTPPIATITATSDYCYDAANKATLVVKASLGVGPYLFSIDNGDTFLPSNTLPLPDDTYTFSDLSPGSYDIFVKDAYGCQSLVSEKADIKSQLFASATNEKDIFCAGTVDGTIKITAVGGYGSYTYTVKNPAGVVSAPTAFPAGLDTAYYTVPAADSGNYEIVVYDAKNCSYVITNAVVMNPPTPVDLLITDIDITPVDCNAPQGTNNNGTITVNLRPVNDSDSYNYTLTPTTPAGLPKTQSINVFSGLAPGKYKVSVTSNLNCEANVDVEILDPVAVTATADAVPFSCTVDPTKTTAVVTGGGGTGTYTFSIDGIRYFASNSIPADNKYTFELGDNGSVQDPTFYVKDSKGCIQTTTLTTALDPLPKLISVVGLFGTDMDCLNNKQEINVTISGGSNVPNPFTYNVYKDGTFIDGPLPVTGNKFTYDALSVGSYYEFEVLDNNTKCSLKSTSYEIPVFDKVKVVASTFANVDCSGNNSGSIEINILNYSGKYDYAVYNGTTPVAGASGSHDTATSNPFVIPFGLVEGNNYTVRIVETDFPSCPATSNSVIITEPDPLDLSGFKVSVKNQNCHDLKAVLTIDETTIVGGTSVYMYAVVPTTTPPTIPAGGDYNPFTTIEIATSEVSPKFDSYDVYVRDAQNCFDHVTVNISRDPMPSITSAIPTQCPSTAGTYDIPVIASGFTPNLQYSLDGNSWGTNSILVVKTTGKHTVYVRDENKCVVTQDVIILEPLKLLYDITGNPTCNGNQGEVTLIPSGGTVTPSYEYTKDNWLNTQTTPVFSGLSPGKYTFSVRDTGTNCTKDVEVVFEIPNTAIDFSLTPSKVLCNGGSTGSITVNMAAQTTTVNNNPVYTYAIDPSPIGTVLVGNVFTNLPKGRYTVTVTSGKGCPVDKIIDVEEPLAITIPNPNVLEFGCTTINKTNNATITVGLPSGGSNDYKVYEFLKNGNPIPVQRGDNPVYIESDLLGGSYVINVYDTNGCLGTTNAVIKPFVAIDFATPSAITVTKENTCINDQEIQVNVTMTGTTTPMPVLSYNVKGVSAGSTYDVINNDGAFSGLTIGNYLVKVTNLSTGCVLTMIHYVNDPNTFELVADNIKNVICYGSSTGSVDLTMVDKELIPSNNAGAFHYTITGPITAAGPLIISGTSGGATINIPNLPAGRYTVKTQLVGPPTCDVETSFLIEQPESALVLSEIHTPITCDPGNDGTIQAAAEGGWLGGDYLYELVGPVSVAYSTQSYFENLKDGVYTLNVKDINGCTDTKTITLKIPDPILVTANATVGNLLCNGDNSGEITVDLPTGGQGTNYLYILNYHSVVPAVSSAPQSSPVFSGLTAGTYSVTVVDGLNCVSQPSADVVINEPSRVEAELKLATGITCKTSATLTLSAIGGTGQYEYSIDKTFAVIAGQFSSSVTFAVGLGDHQYYVRDSRGCIGAISNNITINPVTPLDLKLDLINAVVYCKGSSTAVIDAEAVGGLGNYIYTLLDSAGGIVRPAQPTGYFDLLPKGVYVVRVDSGDCQYSSQAITINEPAEALSVTPTVTDVTCFGADDGKIVIAATGGTGVIKYAISPNLGLFDTKSVFDHLVPGLYQIIVQDENSCFQIIEREIKEPTVLEAKVVGPIIQEICDGDKDGAFTIEITGGKPPYSISLDNENGTYAPVIGTQHSFANLKGGAHKVFVKDATCLTSRDVIMDKAVVLDPITEVSYHCVNNAQANMVVVKINDSNDIADVDYSLDGTGTYQPSNVFMNVAPGTHFIVARHTNGCETQTTSFKIVSYEPFALTLAEDKGVWNIIKATATGGGGDYEYSIDGVNFSTKNEFKIYKTGTYTITVRDKNGCTVSQDYYIKYIDVCLDNYFTPNGDGVYDTWGPGCTNIYDKLEFSIFDRYGRTIAKYHYGQKWDGRYNGAELPSGDYWYVLKLNDENDAREFVGHFTLYR